MAGSEFLFLLPYDFEFQFVITEIIDKICLFEYGDAEFFQFAQILVHHKRPGDIEGTAYLGEDPVPGFGIINRCKIEILHL